MIGAARKLGGKVVLGGHSLGGSVVTAYATWNFDGHAGSRRSRRAGLHRRRQRTARSPRRRHRRSCQLWTPRRASPWLTFGGIAAPFAGLFNATGSLGALLDPNAPSLGPDSSRCCPADLKPPVPVTQPGPVRLRAQRRHLAAGAGRRPGAPRQGSRGQGPGPRLGRRRRAHADQALRDDVLGLGHRRTSTAPSGTSPQRLTDDTGAVGNGNANPAQTVLGVDATMGTRPAQAPADLRVRRALGGDGGADGTRSCWRSSRTSRRANLTLVDRQSTYAHNDPNGAYPAQRVLLPPRARSCGPSRHRVGCSG